MNTFHIAVLLNEAIDALQVVPGKWYIDATIGGGGHAFEILRRGGNVLGIDVDEEALTYVAEEIKKSKNKNRENVRLAKGNFSQIKKIAKENGIEHAAGVLFDLGVSNYQLGHKERGFSFQSDGPLDMRMDTTLGVRAVDLISALSAKELAQIFDRFGEERFAKRIAKVIVFVRKDKKIETTGDLVYVIKKAIGNYYVDNIHFATRVFQALRIAVNDELRNLEQALTPASDLLDSKGRLVTLSFHSLEDRIVKHAFVAFAQEGKGKIITDKPIMATKKEIDENVRSRSAKLRIFEKN